MRATLIRDIGKKIYHKIPAFWRWFFWPLRLTFRLMDISKLDLWILNGEEINSRQELSIAYAGTKINRNYVINIAYDNSFNEKYLGRVWFWKIFAVVKEKSPTCSLMVIALDKLLWRWFTKRTYFNVPFWVSSFGDISGYSSLPQRSESVRQYIKKIRKNELSFEITRDSRLFDNFYYNMHKPYVAAAHGNRAIIHTYNDIKREFENGELLLIKKENQYVAGEVLVYKKTQAGGKFVGVKDGDFNYVKEGAIAALYYFEAHRLKQKGYRKVDFGLSRPFLKDGVLRYKRKWGGYQIASSPEVDGAYYVELVTDTPGLRAFLVNNPFLFIDREKINGAIFVDYDRGFSQEEIGRIYKDYYFDGMSKFYIYHFGDNSKRLHEIPTLQFSDTDRVRFCSAEKLFRKDR